MRMTDTISLAGARTRVAEWQSQHGRPPIGTVELAGQSLEWSPLNSDYTYDPNTRQLSQRSSHARTRLAIVCGAPTRSLAPLDDPHVEVWALNTCFPLDEKDRIRADVWWELHPPHAQTVEDETFIAQNERPCFHVDPTWTLPPCPMTLSYVDHCTQHEWPIYFANSIAFQVMWAAHILKQSPTRWERVELYGVELLMGSPRERTVEAACVSFWLGILWPLVHVSVPEIDGSMIYHPLRYGYDYIAEARRVDMMMAAHLVGDQMRLHRRERASQQ